MHVSAVVDICFTPLHSDAGACHQHQQSELDDKSLDAFMLVSGLVSLHGMHVMQIAAAEAAARAEAEELEGWKRDSTAVLAALAITNAEKITGVSHTNLFCELQLLLSNMTLLQ